MTKSIGILVLLAGGILPSMAQATVTWPGPDAAGYTGTSSTGNTFAPIKGNGGVRQTPADPAAATYDDWFFTQPIGFNFNLYGTANTQAYFSTNGQVSFGGTTNTGNVTGSNVSASYTNGDFGAATFLLGGTGQPQVDRQMVCAWWDDLQFTSGQNGGIYTLNRTVSGVQEFVIEWNNVAFFNSTADGVSFQVILRDNGSMTFNYGDSASSNAGNTLGGSATVGIHDLGGNGTNNRYLQYKFNTAAAVSNGLQINIVPTPGALALLGMGGLLAARRRR